MKDCLEDLLPVIARIINLSFQNAMDPVSFKEAFFDPIATKDLLDNEIYKNIRRNFKFAICFQGN